MTPSVAALAIAAALAQAASPERSPQDAMLTAAASPLHVRITSPLGRMGIPGTIRIVAQVQTAPGAVLSPVQFFVDGVLLGEDRDGPPFAADWEDANPFEARSITVTVADDSGRLARDTVALPPLEILETTEVMSVLLEATVLDADGRAVANLGAGGFTVLEDGRPQALEIVRSDALPTTFALLIDASQSMSRRMDFVKEAATRLGGRIARGDRILVVPFSKRLEAVTGPTDDVATVAQAIASIAPRGGTAILDALAAVAPRLGTFEGRRAVVLLTDGYDEHSEGSFDAALETVKAAGATVYVIGIGGSAGISLKGERLLRRLAAETGGRAFLPSREEELARVHDLLAADIHNRYVLTYTPSNQAVDGSWRKLEVTTADPTHTVRTRDGYFAPKPPPVRPALEFTLAAPSAAATGVSADDLVILEDGVVQRVETFRESVAPVSIVLALDASGSMKKAADAAAGAARRFVQAIRPEDRLATVLFADQAGTIGELSTDRAPALRAIDSYAAAGGTALYDAISASLAGLTPVEGRRVVVVVTDGRDEDNPGTGPGSVTPFDSVLRDLREVGAVVYAIGLGAKVDRAVLETLARASGGEAYFPDDVEGLEEPYRRIIEHLRRRWMIGYTSTNGKRDGRWREVEIRSTAPGASVIGPGGYFAPAK